MDGQAFVALSTIAGFGRCRNAAFYTDHGVTLYPATGNTANCPLCGEKIIYPKGDIARLEVIAETGVDPQRNH